jgi:hypothetical protein
MNGAKWFAGIVFGFVIVLTARFCACTKDHAGVRRSGMNSPQNQPRANSLSAPADDLFLIRDGQVGKVHAGMKLAAVQSLFGRNCVKVGDSPYDSIWDLYDEAVFVYLPGEKTPIFTAGLSEYPWNYRGEDYDLRDETLGPIVVDDGRFHTAEGIRVGSTVAEIRRAYLDLKIVWQHNWYWDIYSERFGLKFNLRDPFSRPGDDARIKAIEVSVPRPVVDWHTYANKKYQVSFRYPGDLVVREKVFQEAPNCRGLLVSILAKNKPGEAVLDLFIYERGKGMYYLEAAYCRMHKQVYFNGFPATICDDGGSASVNWAVYHLEKQFSYRWRPCLAGEEERNGPRDWAYPILSILRSVSYSYPE